MERRARAAMGCASLRMGGCGAGAGCTCSAAVAVGNERSRMSFQIMRAASVPAVTSMGKAALPTTMGKLLLVFTGSPACVSWPQCGQCCACSGTSLPQAAHMRCTVDIRLSPISTPHACAHHKWGAANAQPCCSDTNSHDQTSTQSCKGRQRNAKATQLLSMTFAFLCVPLCPCRLCVAKLFFCRYHFSATR